MRKTVSLSVLLFGMIMVAAAISAHPGLWAGEQKSAAFQNTKIDSLLEKKMTLDERTIPFIILFSDPLAINVEELKVSGLEIRTIYHLIAGAAAEGSPSAIRELARLESVECLYWDSTVKVSRPITRVEGLEAASPSSMVDAQSLWSMGINGAGIKVAVIDSGIDKNHPDLNGKVIDEINFVETEETTEDLLGHGTMCAGIIAGSGQASGGKHMGIAPGASLLNVRVIDSEGDGQVSDIISGIEWALDNDADILSLSLGGMNPGEINPPLTMAADNAMDAGAVVCVAAGNSG